MKKSKHFRDRRYRDGFQSGHIPVRETPLKDVVIVGKERVYQVKRRDKAGQIVELYPRTWLRNNWIVIRFFVWRFTSSITRFFSETLSRASRLFSEEP